MLWHCKSQYTGQMESKVNNFLNCVGSTLDVSVAVTIFQPRNRPVACFQRLK